MLEHGAGHPRKDFEDERDELARRFREKYGSDHPSGEQQRSNVAPYFVGVFDTVAALGATGLRRFLIQLGVYALIALGGLALGLVLGLLSSVMFDASFWRVLGVTEVLSLLMGMAWLQLKQRRDVKKTIQDYPKPGESRSHMARWEGKNFNRLLSRFVTYARSANAIDETRADFDRVPWGPTVKGPQETAGIRPSSSTSLRAITPTSAAVTPRSKSRLSDIALAWMLEEAVTVPSGLKVGPVYINGEKMADTGDRGTALYLYPAEDGVQHSEIAGMRDTLDSFPRLLSRLVRNKNYAEKIRTLPEDATAHPSVFRRLRLPNVQHAGSFEPYRPAALRLIKAAAEFFEKA